MNLCKDVLLVAGIETEIAASAAILLAEEGYDHLIAPGTNFSSWTLRGEALGIGHRIAGSVDSMAGRIALEQLRRTYGELDSAYSKSIAAGELVQPIDHIEARLGRYAMHAGLSLLNESWQVP